MKRCRCVPTCTLEIKRGDPIVEVVFYDSPRAPMLVALPHIINFHHLKTATKEEWDDTYSKLKRDESQHSD